MCLEQTLKPRVSLESFRLHGNIWQRQESEKRGEHAETTSREKVYAGDQRIYMGFINPNTVCADSVSPHRHCERDDIIVRGAESSLSVQGGGAGGEGDNAGDHFCR